MNQSILKESNKQTFLSLVRLGIGHPVGVLPETIDWAAMRAIANEQGLDAIVLDGVLALKNKGKLTDGSILGIAFKMQWIGSVIRNYEQKYEDYKKRIGELAGFFNTHGFKLMILKGYGLSLNYPVPNHRPCGDIDTWAFGRHKEVDAAISKELGIPIIASHSRHSVFSFNGFTVENHCTFMNSHGGHRRPEMERTLKMLSISDCSSSLIFGQTFFLPSPAFNVLFLLQHMMSHFSLTRMSFRQLLDWGFFIQSNCDSIDWAWFKDILSEFHMTDFFSCVNAICIEDLGFSPNLFPSYIVNAELKSRVLDDLFSPEYFYYSPKCKVKQVSRIAYKYHRWKSNAWKYDFCYGDKHTKAFVTRAWSHLLKTAKVFLFE